jgi:excisionase family DNA binding protein
MKRPLIEDPERQQASHLTSDSSTHPDGSTTREIVLTAFRDIDRRLAVIETRMPAPKLLTVSEAADALSVSVQTIRRWCKSGRVPYVRRGHELRIDLSDVRALSTDDIAAMARDR